MDSKFKFIDEGVNAICACYNENVCLKIYKTNDLRNLMHELEVIDYVQKAFFDTPWKSFSSFPVYKVIDKTLLWDLNVWINEKRKTFYLYKEVLAMPYLTPHYEGTALMKGLSFKRTSNDNLLNQDHLEMMIADIAAQTLYLQKLIPGWRHNDARAGNVIAVKNTWEGDFTIPRTDLKLKGRANGDPRFVMIDFGFSTGYKFTQFIPHQSILSLKTGINSLDNPVYDLHTLLYSLHASAQNDNSLKLIKELIDRHIPQMYLRESIEGYGYLFNSRLNYFIKQRTDFGQKHKEIFDTSLEREDMRFLNEGKTNLICCYDKIITGTGAVFNLIPPEISTFSRLLEDSFFTNQIVRNDHNI
jgi:hypothetical protein